MRKNSQALSPYYQRTAFVRDADSMELAESLIGGIEACVSFQLPLNSSLLNQWTDLPLQLSGLYTPSIQTCPIASGIDVANSSALTEAVPSPTSLISVGQNAASIFIDQSISIPKPLQTNEFFSPSIHNSPFRESTMSSRKNPFMRPYTDDYDDNDEIEEIASDAIIDDDIEHDVQLTALLSRVDALTADSISEAPESEIQVQLPNAAKSESEPIIEAVDPFAGSSSSPQMGNSIVSRMGWSSTDETTVLEAVDPSAVKTAPITLSRSSSINNSSSVRSPIDRHSYNSLLRRGKSTQDDGLYTRQIDFNDVWQRFEGSLGIGNYESTSTGQDGNTSATASEPNDLADDGFDFEFVRADSFTTKFLLTELQEMVQQTFKIAHEHGLDAQNFACLSCGNPLGVGGSGYTTTQ